MATTTTVGPYPAHERRLDLPGSPVLLRFDGGVSDEDVAFFAEALRIVREDLGDCGPVTVHIYSNPEDLSGAWAHRYPTEPPDNIRRQIHNGLSQTARFENWWVYTPNLNVPGPPLRGVHHEYFHILQKCHMQRDFFIPQGLPWWVAEGSAEYFGAVAAAARGVVNFSSYRAPYVRRLRQIPEPIEAFESQGGSSVAVAGASGAAMVVGFFASEYLVDTHGEAKWKQEYWQALRSPAGAVGQPLGRQPTKEWASAFETVFGMPLQQFYAEFETHRPTIG